MKIGELSSYVAGFAKGVILSVIIASWNEITVAYRIVYIVLLGLLFFARGSFLFPRSPFLPPLAPLPGLSYTPRACPDTPFCWERA